MSDGGNISHRNPISSRIDFTSSSLSDEELFQIWEGVSRFIERNLSNQKGVHIPNFGTFSFVQKKLDVGNSKYLLIQRPVFQLFEKICQTHGLSQTKHHVTGSVPVVQLNYSALSVESAFDRDKVETCVRETLGALNRSIASQRNVELAFCRVGRLQVRSGKVKFKFYKDFVNSLDQSGTVVRALQERPGTADSVMTDRPASRAFSVALPKLGSKGAALMPINEDEIVQGECAAVQTDREMLEGDVSSLRQDELPATSRRNTSRPSAPVAMATDYSELVERPSDRPDIREETPTQPLDEDKENERQATSQEVADSNVADVARSPSLLPPPRPPSMTQTETPPATTSRLPPPRPPSSTTSSCGHAGAGQELCYVCHQRQRRNVPISFAEELKRRNDEEDRLLHAYNDLKDKERILKEQEQLLAKRHDAQKVSAFNLGVSEAQKEKQREKDTDNRPSYIFQARPLTPSRRIKQGALSGELARQVADKQASRDRVRADEAFLEKLEQVQLAEDLAAQRDQFMRDREQQKEMYRRALSAQLRYKPMPLPAREPDSATPVFGRNDVTEDKLLERRRRAQEVAQSQLDDVSSKKREDLLRRLQEQKYEEEVLKRTKEDLIRDRAWRYERQERNRKRLESDWSQAVQLKRERDLLERLRASSPGGLLHEQCDGNRRCGQCRRRLNNGGETNIWCESYYVPGSRYIT